MKSLNGIKALINKDHNAVCKLSDYTCGIREFNSLKQGGYCGSDRCKDKLLEDVLSMGEKHNNKGGNIE